MATIDVKVPDIGDFRGVSVAVLELQEASAAPAPAPGPAPESAPPSPPPPLAPAEPAAAPRQALASPAASSKAGALPHASPSIRRYARELGVPLDRVKGSGHRGRITPQDVQALVKQAIARPPAAAAAGSLPGLLPWPQTDFTKFGRVERRELSRIKKISGANLHRNWLLIPHVTNHDEADVTELETLRMQVNKEHEKAGIKVTMLSFLVKAAVTALKKFPEFNASLEGEQLVLKHYFHIGFAADTPNGLVVPVIKDADRKGILQISQEMSELSQRAREGKLGAADMAGGCFSISSLGGIGGSYFTPIINAPEVAILGVGKSRMVPHWNGTQFVPRLSLPLSLSWDHRVIDGAMAGRFNAYLGSLLADFRRITL